jgi:hypothetical protein
MWTRGEYRGVRHDRHLSAASSQIRTATPNGLRQETALVILALQAIILVHRFAAGETDWRHLTRIVPGPISGSYVDELVRNQSLGAALSPGWDAGICAGSMTQSIYNIVTAPSGWVRILRRREDRRNLRIKRIALEAAAVAAALAAGDGRAIQINVPGDPES